MSTKRTLPDGQLFAAEPSPTWTVRKALYGRNDILPEGTVNYPGKHALYYLKRRMLSGKGAANLDRFERLAAHFNLVNAKPRAVTRCAADGNSIDTTLSLQSRRSIKAGTLPAFAPPDFFDRLKS